MDNKYVKEILEFLRGKTIIDMISLNCESPITESMKNRLQQDLACLLFL